MPQRSNDFQAMILLVQKCIGDSSNVEESVMLTDESTGAKREVDVVVRGAVGGIPVVVGMECVDTARPADVGWVERMHAKHEHVPTDILVLVSRSGYTATARSKAEHYNAVLLELGEPDDKTTTLMNDALTGWERPRMSVMALEFESIEPRFEWPPGSGEYGYAELTTEDELVDAVGEHLVLIDHVVDCVRSGGSVPLALQEWEEEGGTGLLVLETDPFLYEPDGEAIQMFLNVVDDVGESATVPVLGIRVSYRVEVEEQDLTDFQVARVGETEVAWGKHDFGTGTEGLWTFARDGDQLKLAGRGPKGQTRVITVQSAEDIAEHGWREPEET